MKDINKISQQVCLTTAVFIWIAILVVLVSVVLTAPISAQVASHAPTALATQQATQPSSAAFAQSPVPLVTGKPVARVNGVALTDRDLLHEMFTIFPYARQHNGFPKSMEADIRKGALEMVVFEELVYQEAERQKTTVPDAQLARAVSAFRKQFSSREEYQSYLRTETSGSEEVLRSHLRRSLVINAYLKAEVTDKSAVSLAATRAYYDKHPERFTYKESFVFQSISIMPPENANADALKEARRKAEDALRQAKATKSYQDFGLLAEKISEDDFRVNMGDHKIVERDQLPPEIIKAASTMKQGEVSELIPLGKTFTIFRLNDHVPAGVRKFEEVKVQLRKDLQKDKEERLRNAVDAKLRKSAKVEEL